MHAVLTCKPKNGTKDVYSIDQFKFQSTPASGLRPESYFNSLPACVGIRPGVGVASKLNLDGLACCQYVLHKIAINRYTLSDSARLI